jgi:hypothetical protein
MRAAAPVLVIAVAGGIIAPIRMHVFQSMPQAIVRHLTDREAVFEFKIQLQTDPDCMKIEDASSEWDEAVSVPIVAATIRIPQQDAAAIRAAIRQCEHLSFNPWHSLAEHRPMGGINRLRRAVYEESFAKRSQSQSSPSCPSRLRHEW